MKTLHAACLAALGLAGPVSAQSPDFIWQDLLEETASVASVEFSPDGRTLVVASGFTNCGGEFGDCSGEGGFSVYDAATGEVVYARMPYPGSPRDAAYSPDGSLLAVDTDLRAASDGSLIRTLFLPDGTPWDVTFSRDGTFLFVGLAWGAGEGLAVYRVSDGALLNTFDIVDPEVNRIALSPDGARLAVADYPLIKIFDLEDEYSLVAIENPHAENPAWMGSLDLAWSPDGRTLASVGTDNAKLFDAQTGEQLQTYWLDPGANEHGFAIAVSNDGAVIAVGGGEAQFGQHGTLNFFDAASGENLAHFEDQTGTLVKDLRYSSDGARIAFVSEGTGFIGAVVAVIENPLGPCYADFTGEGVLDLFDFLEFMNAFNAQEDRADCTEDGAFDFFDFLCFTNAFKAGC
jgi:WD40 repeat protein